ncbi:hypothetical protein MN116_000148, partial [Schistosoma mekongi]
KNFILHLMLTLVTFHLRPMNFLFYWFMPLMLYYSTLFLDNSEAEDVYYNDSELMELNKHGSYRSRNNTNQSSLLFKDIGFSIGVHQMTIKSLIAFRFEGTVFMADTFEIGNSIRSFRIVGTNQPEGRMYIDTYDNVLVVNWLKLNYCKSHPNTYVNVRVLIFQDGIIQYHIGLVSGTTENCNMTIEIEDGIYNVSADENRIITKEKLIHRKFIPDSSVIRNKVFTFIPNSICLAQASKNICTTGLLRNVNCTWCSSCKICMQNTLPCNCFGQTEATTLGKNEEDDIDSLVQYQLFTPITKGYDEYNESNIVVHRVTESIQTTNDSNGSTKDYQSTNATSQNHDENNGISTVVHRVTELIQTTNDSNDSTKDYQSSKTKSQRHVVVHIKSTTDSQLRVAGSKRVYYILGIVLGSALIAAFIVGVIVRICYQSLIQLLITYDLN